jgi:hypothetical protein
MPTPRDAAFSITVCSAMRSVAAANVAQMALVHSSKDELRKGFLFQGSGMPVAALGRSECRKQRFGRDQVTDAWCSDTADPQWRRDRRVLSTTER